MKGLSARKDCCTRSWSKDAPLHVAKTDWRSSSEISAWSFDEGSFLGKKYAGLATVVPVKVATAPAVHW